MQEIKYHSYFTGRGDAPRQYPWMSLDEDCEIVIAGGGIAGCAAAYELSEAGIDVVLLSQKPIGFSSTPVNSSALSFANDFLLAKLSKTVGKDHAVRCFTLCGEALDELERFSAESEPDFCFRRRDAFLYVTSAEQADEIHTEYLMRKHNGFPAEFLERQEAGERFSFDVQAGILAKDAGGETDGYLLCHALCRATRKNGARIYENTAVVAAENTEGGVQVTTGHERVVQAKKLLLANGWRQKDSLPAAIGKRSLFTVVSEPVTSFSGYESRALIKNAETGISLRTTADDRILAWNHGSSLPESEGKLSRFFPSEKLARKKYGELAYSMREMLCGIRGIRAEYAYCGAYGTTRDGLPVIGEHPDYDNVYFDMPSGKNGILFSLIGGKLLAELYHGEEGDELFSPTRPTI